jgi:hypothetical protein
LAASASCRALRDAVSGGSPQLLAPASGSARGEGAVDLGQIPALKRSGATGEDCLVEPGRAVIGGMALIRWARGPGLPG